MTSKCAIDCRLHPLDCASNSDDLELGGQGPLQGSLKGCRFASKPLTFAGTINRLRSESEEETAVAFAYMADRATEIDKEHPDHKEACKRLDAARHAQRLTEQLRRTPVEEILEMLG